MGAVVISGEGLSIAEIAAVARGEKAAVFVFDETTRTFIARSEKLGFPVRQLIARGDPRHAALHVHARADLAVGGGERDVLASDAARADLAQRRPVRPHEEAADDRLLDAAGGAPRLQLRLPAQERDAQLGALDVVRRDVDCRARASGEVEPHAAGPAGTRGAEVFGGCEGHGHWIVQSGAVGVNNPLA